MSSFDVADPLKLAGQLVDGTLQGAATGVQLAAATLDGPLDAGVPGVSVGATAGATLSVFGYGDGSGTDPAGIVGRPLPKAGAADALVLPPPLSPEGKVYLAYRLDADARAGGGGGVGFFGASAEAERRLTLSDYHGHAPTEQVRDAVLADLSGLRHLLRPGDVAGLKLGDALAMSTAGRLSASLSVSWADVLPGVLGRLSALLPGVDHLVALQTNLGASLHAEASVVDDLVLVLSRPEAGQLRVSVLRGETRSAGAGAALSATVSFDATAPVEAVLGALVGKPVAWMDGVVAQLVQSAQVTEADHAALQWVLGRLGMLGLQTDPTVLLARWQSLKDQLLQRFRDTVTVRLSAGLTYDVQRTEQGQALFQAVLPDAEALAQHAALARGDLTALLQALGSTGRSPEVYLRQQSVERRRAWGFSLGLPGLSASSTDEDRLRFCATTRQDGQRRLAALGSRTYRGDLLGATAEWNAELRAEMAEFAAAPKAGDFQYGLHLLLHREEKGPAAGVLAQLVDDAVVWGAIGEGDRPEVLQQVTAKAGRGTVDARVELTVGDQGLRALLAAASGLGRPQLARALARAMPWYGWRARQNAEVRASVYAPLWEGLLRDGGWAPKAAAAAAATALAHHPMASDVAASEGQWPAPGLLTFASLVNAYPTAAATSQRMVAGLQALAGSIESTLPADAIDAAFRQLSGGWSQSFLLKAFGALVAGLAAQKGVLKQVERTFTVSCPEADALLTFTTSK